MLLGYRLRELRKDRDLSQAQLAKQLNVSVYTISSYECEKTVPSDDIKLKIAKMFDVSLDYLLGLVDKPYSYKRRVFPISLPRQVSEDDLRKIQEYADMVVRAKAKVLV
jgi:transcriptional regulator with XRE-family HTH domain